MYSPCFAATSHVRSQLVAPTKIAPCARSIARKMIAAVTCCFPHCALLVVSSVLVMCVSAAYPCSPHIFSSGLAQDSRCQLLVYHSPACLYGYSAPRCRWSSALRCYPHSMRSSSWLAESHRCFLSNQKWRVRLFLGQDPARYV